MKDPEPWESLNRATALIGSGKLAEAAELADGLLAEWESEAREGISALSLGAAIRTMKAHIARERNDLEAARADYQRALTMLEEAEDDESPNPALLNQRANIWTNCGIALLGSPAEADLEEAGRCFDQAITIREGLPLEQEPAMRWGLAAAWMNRAEIWTRLQREESPVEALRCYDQALEQLDHLPEEGNPSCRTRKAVAWMNRGLALRLSADPDHLKVARDSLARAVAILDEAPQPPHEEHRRMLACALLNQATYILEFPEEDDHLEAGQAAARAGELITPEEEREDMALAEAAIRARYLQCRVIGRSMELGVEAEKRAALLAEASDLVEAGLDLEQGWSGSDLPEFRHHAADLFRFGCRVYGSFQPQFLAEFVLEYAAPGGAVRPDLAPIALEELRRVGGLLQRDGFGAFNSPEFDRWQRLQTDIHAAIDQLRPVERGRV